MTACGVVWGESEMNHAFAGSSQLVIELRSCHVGHRVAQGWVCSSKVGIQCAVLLIWESSWLQISWSGDRHRKGLGPEGRVTNSCGGIYFPMFLFVCEASLGTRMSGSLTAAVGEVVMARLKWRDYEKQPEGPVATVSSHVRARERWPACAGCLIKHRAKAWKRAVGEVGLQNYWKCVWEQQEDLLSGGTNEMLIFWVIDITSTLLPFSCKLPAKTSRI